MEEILGIDTKKYQLSVIIPFGYRINEHNQLASREPLENIVQIYKWWISDTFFYV